MNLHVDDPSYAYVHTYYEELGKVLTFFMKTYAKINPFMLKRPKTALKNKFSKDLRITLIEVCAELAILCALRIILRAETSYSCALRTICCAFRAYSCA